MAESFAGPRFHPAGAFGGRSGTTEPGPPPTRTALLLTGSAAHRIGAACPPWGAGEHDPVGLCAAMVEAARVSIRSRPALSKVVPLPRAGRRAGSVVHGANCPVGSAPPTTPDGGAPPAGATAPRGSFARPTSNAATWSCHRSDRRAPVPGLSLSQPTSPDDAGQAWEPRLDGARCPSRLSQGRHNPVARSPSARDALHPIHHDDPRAQPAEMRYSKAGNSLSRLDREVTSTMHRDKRRPCCTARGGVLHPGSDIVMDELSERERAVGSPLVPSADSEDADGAER